MPELPEAETIARQLHAAITGRVLGPVKLVRPDVVKFSPGPLPRLVRGRRVLEVRRRAKRVLIVLEHDLWIVVRLGMTGRLEVISRGAPVLPHTHVRITIEGTDQEVRYRDPRRFGGIWCFAGTAEADLPELASLGPEPLDLNGAGFRRVLSRSRQIKALLLDQSSVAGLGNIYCDEALFAAGIHPLRRADSLSSPEAARLLRAIKSVLRRAIRHQGSTLVDYRQPNGEPGSFQRLHRVYQREGKPCRCCGAKIERILAAGRSTFICLSCQPPADRS